MINCYENSEIQTTRDEGAQNVLVEPPYEHLQLRIEELLRARSDYRRRLFGQLIKDQIQTEVLRGDYDLPCQKWSEVLRSSLAKRDKVAGDVYKLITISLPHIDPHNLTSEVHRYNKIIRTRVFVPHGAIWVYEQRGFSDQTYLNGIHIHLVMPKGRKYPNEIIRDLAVPFKLEPNFINIVDRPKEAALKYLLGEKTGMGNDGCPKASKQTYDDRMRLEFQIENHYEK